MRIYYLWDDQYCLDYVNSIWSFPTDNGKHFILFNEPTNDITLSSVTEYDLFEVEFLFSDAVRSGYLSLGFVQEVESFD